MGVSGRRGALRQAMRNRRNWPLVRPVGGSLDVRLDDEDLQRNRQQGELRRKAPPERASRPAGISRDDPKTSAWHAPSGVGRRHVDPKVLPPGASVMSHDDVIRFA